jgi:adenylate cyclase
MSTPRVERRLVAILAADVVGYSRLVERDERGTLERLEAVRRELVEPLLAEHRGRLFKLMGDGLLAAFGSVVDAVGCALAIQRALAAHEAAAPEPLRLRLGVNLGDVVEGEAGDLLGEGVIVAARLQRW